MGPNFMQDAKSMKGLLSNLTPFLCGSLMNKASGRRSCLSCSSLPPCGADLHEKLEDYETSAIVLVKTLLYQTTLLCKGEESPLVGNCY